MALALVASCRGGEGITLAGGPNWLASEEGQSGLARVPAVAGDPPALGAPCGAAWEARGCPIAPQALARPLRGWVVGRFVPSLGPKHEPQARRHKRAFGLRLPSARSKTTSPCCSLSKARVPSTCRDANRGLCAPLCSVGAEADGL
eukprot:15472723-Alexandrium_andersonii.AAC.2